MCLSGISDHGVSCLTSQWGSIIKLPWVRTVRSRYPFWYDLRCCKDVRLPQQTRLDRRGGWVKTSKFGQEWSLLTPYRLWETDMWRVLGGNNIRGNPHGSLQSELKGHTTYYKWSSIHLPCLLKSKQLYRGALILFVGCLQYTDTTHEDKEWQKLN